jgi:hypothetical protein
VKILSVIGAGLSRTGTLSLKFALELLGFGPCYHMLELISQPGVAKHWLRAASGDPMNWDEVFRDYHSTVDLPSCVYYRSLAEYYPQAKVVLTVRDSESWYRSIHATIFSEIEIDPPDRGLLALTQIMQGVVERHLGGRTDDRDSVVAGYERHNEEVQRTIPKERLLIYRVTEGWGPLSRFLGVSAPDVPFPMVNTSADFRTGATNHTLTKE